jgi:tetratricopeptide (TPR) repeat protein
MASAFEPPESSGVSERERVLRFLSAAGWTDFARREAYAVLANDSADSINERCNALLRLADFAGDENDDAIAIEHLTALCGLLQQRDPQSAGPLQYVFRSQIAWRKARLAQSKGDLTEANKQIDALMALAAQAAAAQSPLGQPVVLDACPVILSLGRRDDAEKLFKPAYEAARQELAENPNSTMEMNSIAWLCAQCDQELSEGLALAKQAVEAEPDNSAYLDTLADLAFRLSYVDEAVKLETRALELEPGDRFMSKQLERFKAGHGK